jgi:hypothetical protein
MAERKGGRREEIGVALHATPILVYPTPGERYEV